MVGGVGKLSYYRRLTFIENHLKDIFDSADNAVDGKRWWIDAEDPFQCVAACISLSDALRSPSSHYVISYLPIHQVITGHILNIICISVILTLYWYTGNILNMKNIYSNLNYA